MEKFSALLAFCVEFSGRGEFPSQRPVTRSFDVFFDLCLNKQVSKQSRGWWSETQSSLLWRRCNYIIPGYEIVGFACVWSCIHDVDRVEKVIPWHTFVIVWLCACSVVLIVPLGKHNCAWPDKNTIPMTFICNINLLYPPIHTCNKLARLDVDLGTHSTQHLLLGMDSEQKYRLFDEIFVTGSLHWQLSFWLTCDVANDENFVKMMTFGVSVLIPFPEWKITYSSAVVTYTKSWSGWIVIFKSTSNVIFSRFELSIKTISEMIARPGNRSSFNNTHQHCC